MTDKYLSDLMTGNIGIALGKTSNDLCAIDLDVDELTQPFRSSNPWTAHTAITHGARGCQIWCRIRGEYPSKSGLKYNDNPCGEWRSDGSQSIVPPSIHPESGSPYEFITEHPVAVIDYNEIIYPSGMVGPSMHSENSQTHKHTTQYTQLCPPISSIPTAIPITNEDCHPLLSAGTVSDDCLAFHQSLVEPHLAREKSHNNAKLFKLAQAVRLATELGKAVNKDLVFDIWWAKSAPFTKPTLNKDVYRNEFHRALESVQRDPLTKAWTESATTVAPGSEVLEIPDMRRLAALCYCLRNPAGRFFLSCRTVGMLFELHHQDAFLWLRALEGRALIRSIERGSHQSHKATEYEYIGGL